MVDSNRNISASHSPRSSPVPERVLLLSAIAAWQGGLLVAWLQEAARLKSHLQAHGSAGVWWSQPDWDGTWFLPLMMAAPFCWGFNTAGLKRLLNRMGAVGTQFVLRRGLGMRASKQRRMLACVWVAGLSLATTREAARLSLLEEAPAAQIQNMLPLVQDEFSYQLQARALLEHRWSWPTPTLAPELFHQMHVLNQGRFASRYFPGTGLWLAPWTGIGHPQLGSQVAIAAACVGLLGLGTLLHSLTAGVIAGTLCALAPAAALFGNLQLSHAPNLLALMLFLVCIVRWMQTRKSCWAWGAGSGLAFAMLCRPLTAAAIGFPFGLWILLTTARSVFVNGSALRGEVPAVKVFGGIQRGELAGFAVPLLAGFGIIAWQNLAITGELLVTPYQQYQQLYTPRHAFGFHQALHLNDVPDSRTRLAAYDDWAVDHSVSRGAVNSMQRLQGSLSWWTGLVPLTCGVIAAGLTLPWQSLPFQLVFASAVCLHLAHVPYWLSGILDHHYVLESGPVWVLVFAIIGCQLCEFRWRESCALFPLWWAALIGAAVVMNFVPCEQGHSSRLMAAWRTLTAPTRGARIFQQVVQSSSLQVPALILVNPHAGDLHVQYVRNLPPFTADVLVGMNRPELYSLSEVSRLFPERTIYQYHSQRQRLVLYAPGSSGESELAP